MIQPAVLRELLQLFERPDVPDTVRMAIAGVLGQARFEPAKDALLAGMADSDAAIRSSCVKALSIDWELPGIEPLLVDILLNDEVEFVRIDAAAGLGALKYRQALPTLKRVILEESHHMTLREAAYEAVLSILGKNGEEFPEIGKPTVIDWDLVHNL